MASSSRSRFRRPAGSQLVGATGALFGALVSIVGTFMAQRPNRVLDGDNLSLLQTSTPGFTALMIAWLLILLTSLLWNGRAGAVTRGLLANAVIVGSSVLIAQAATTFRAAAGESARVSLGISFWLIQLACYIVIFSALQELDGFPTRMLVSLSGFVGVSVLLFTGQLSSLSIMQEYAVNAESFRIALVQQLAYTVGATSIGLVLGLIAGFLAAKRPRTEGPIFGTLNVAQVLPALSFIGLLIVPMGWLGANVPFLGAIGVSGIGWAPVFVVLVSWAVYPITRNVFTGLSSLDAGVVDAAVGMGMASRQRVWAVELPLITPVVLAGVRIAAVQTTGAAILAALVGGGGLGTIVFFGVQQAAEDLVLLGVIPIVVLSLTIDAMLRFAEKLVLKAQGGVSA
jgi:osmoprotectant transport system permease protein